MVLATAKLPLWRHKSAEFCEISRFYLWLVLPVYKVAGSWGLISCRSRWPSTPRRDRRCVLCWKPDTACPSGFVLVFIILLNPHFQFWIGMCNKTTLWGIHIRWLSRSSTRERWSTWICMKRSDGKSRSCSAKPSRMNLWEEEDVHLDTGHSSLVPRFLKHPHVIRLYELLDTPSDIFMVGS